MDEKCETCPLRDFAGLACLGQRNKVACRRAAQPGQEAFRADLVKHARQPEECPDANAKRAAVAEQIALIGRMKACPSWVASSDCGCGNNRCRQGKGQDGIVSHADCFACLREADATQGQEVVMPEVPSRQA